MLFWALLACGGDKGETGASEGEGEGAEVATISAAVTGLGFVSDAVPSPDASRVFYLTGGPWGLWSSFFDGSGGAEQLADFTAPRNVVVDPEGETLWVSDGAGVSTLPVDGGEPALIPETEGMSPEGLHLHEDGAARWLYLTGLDPEGGGAIGLHRLPADGGAVETVAEGSPFYSPQGVVVDAAGEVAWVCDGAAGADGSGALIRVEGGEARRVLDGFEAGSPCGVALSADGAVVLISSIGAEGKSQLLLYDVARAEADSSSEGIGENVGSGGMHGAWDAPGVYAWTGLRAGGEGVVHRLEVE